MSYPKKLEIVCCYREMQDQILPEKKSKSKKWQITSLRHLEANTSLNMRWENLTCIFSIGVHMQNLWNSDKYKGENEIAKCNFQGFILLDSSLYKR